MEVMSLLDALKSKYSLLTDICKRYLSTNNCGSVDPTVGLLIPDILFLTDCNINCIGDTDEVYNLCGNVKELDVAQNLISEWKEILCILSQMPCLEFLNVSNNPLKSSIFPPLQNHNLQKLALNNTSVTWDIVNCLLMFLPWLKELHLSLNNMRDVQLTVTHSHLQELYFNDNPLIKWSEIYKVGEAFSNLKSLIMSNIKSVEELDHPDNIPQTFPHLHSLNISKMNLQTWEEVDKFNLFPSLTELRIQGLPLFDEYNDKVRRHLTIGRLPKIKTLNGSHINVTEREEAERAFLRFYMNHTHKPSRYSKLEAIHGKLLPLAEVDLKPKESITIVVFYLEKQKLHNVNVTQTVMQLKQSLVEFCGLPVKNMRLYYTDVEFKEVQSPEEMRFNERKLFNYKMKDGDEILIVKRE